MPIVSAVNSTTEDFESPSGEMWTSSASTGRVWADIEPSEGSGSDEKGDDRSLITFMLASVLLESDGCIHAKSELLCQSFLRPEG